MPSDDQTPATKHDIVEAEERMMSQLRDFITGEFREQYINDMKVLNEQLTYDFNGIFKDRTEQHADRIEQHDRDIQSIKIAIGMSAEPS